MRQQGILANWNDDRGLVFITPVAGGPRVFVQPGVSDPTIRLTLEPLKNEGKVMPEGRGRSAAWVKAPDPIDHESPSLPPKRT